MSKSINITRHYRDVLPKVKGYRFEVSYIFDNYPILGNTSIYLWEKHKFLPSIAGTAYLRVDDSDSVDKVRELVYITALLAIEDAKKRGYSLDRKGLKAPKNVTGGK